METVFITIHDLSLDARIRYCSSSITDILGYKPNEVKGKSCWEYFHPDEIPFAKEIQGKNLHLDTAASLKYCRIKHKDGTWIGCECVFTVVHDVLVASTAIYQQGSRRNMRRAYDAPVVRNIFSSAPRDQRYHMLGYLSEKFRQPVGPAPREPRAAFILNRFSRTSTIMYATNGVEQILGIKPTQVMGRSFYHCIADSCMSDAVRVMESAKGNDSIAYMRFYFRDPNRPSQNNLLNFSSDSESDSDTESEDGGAPLSRSSRESSTSAHSDTSLENVGMEDLAVHESAIESNGYNHDSPPEDTFDRERTESTESSRNSTNGRSDSIFDPPMVPSRSSESSVSPQSTPPAEDLIEVEAVISCTSDGLVVVLRGAHASDTALGSREYHSGIFASPWATDPILPEGLDETSFMPNIVFPPQQDAQEASFMGSIKDIAVFAWSLTGINGSIVDHATGSGKPTGEALPPAGLSIWDPNAPPGQNDQHNGFSGSTHRLVQALDDFEKAEKASKVNGKKREVEPVGHEESSSEDEVLWKRVPQMPAFSRPKRKASYAESSEDSDGGAPLNGKRRRKMSNDGRR